MREGQLTGEVPYREATEEKIIALASLHSDFEEEDTPDKVR
jgi:hypothetical protein